MRKERKTKKTGEAMTIPQIRVKLYQAGYALNYTFGITKTAVVYPRLPGKIGVFKVDMKDAVLGRKELEKLLSTKVL